MPDMPTEFWSGWIAVITSVSLLGLGWFVFSIFFSKRTGADSPSPVWDETLSEGNNPAPMWWFWMIFSAMIISVIYLILYPGLGSFSGVLKWSQGGRLDDSMATYEQRYADERQSLLAASLAELRQDDVAMASARRIFDQNCSACHGPDGQGQAAMFPSLMDSDWQWGGDASSIEQSIRKGRTATMVGWEAILGVDGVNNVGQFVASLSNGETVDLEAPGRTQYMQFCMACHGPTGTGIAAVGGPNLTDDVWLYGGSDADLNETISHGRNGLMPAFENRLDSVQIKLMVAWLTQPDEQ
ncbi:MAG: cytochrome-c oxidase, cbb3-type subunit III [Woeseia sp.]|nr:cytochrome-c oxidase, cbb3-type subunit III [Woeseia sp.]MBT6209675.1 cytochrome-c oxidase, cbb3-type subunit III [Woeseia sp.]